MQVNFPVTGATKQKSMQKDLLGVGSVNATDLKIEMMIIHHTIIYRFEEVASQSALGICNFTKAKPVETTKTTNTTATVIMFQFYVVFVSQYCAHVEIHLSVSNKFKTKTKIKKKNQPHKKFSLTE